ncbi:enoyl-CoA hydratase/isomerase family protein [Desulfosporosinus sp. PR]|uniref:enoyl-CoA hydratase/isomerase family protein n=1 Tax=Candidatus Desulfosporosinus nitrosoreducens TaxID=3401928 RepID=UPI0027F3BC33|nr:enoyl-CoA hydratase/isomerase family protein [Desulfosporosinus sp. PR]MDQ7096424.1 enoyl-CoA hydratase/isomerase family protein [Desulfosporosinus sp. PR]
MSNNYGSVIKFEKQDYCGALILDNAEKMNVVGDEFLKELGALQQDILGMEELRALAIVANGDNFSAGIDLKMLHEVSSEKVKATLTHLQGLYSFWQTLSIPVVIGVQGFCFGSAVELMLGCDIRIAAENLRLSLPEVKLGLAPDMGGTTRLTKLVGTGQAKRLIMACEEIGAEEALQIGLVEKVVPADKLREATIRLAQKMAAYPPSSVAFAKKGINLAAESSVAAGLLFEQAQSTYCCGTEDLKEAISAFFEKRKPSFRGR